MELSSPLEFTSIQTLLTQVQKKIRELCRFVQLDCEVSEIKEAQYCLFVTFKDQSGTIRGIIPKRYYRQGLTDGDRIHLVAELSMYKNSVQVSAREYQILGVGDVHQRFLKIKKDLDRKGYFNITRKRSVHNRYRRIGVVTSLKAAGFKDMMETFYHRMVAGEIVVYPSLVQGKEAPAQVCRAIQQANQHQYVEILVIARGGGSKEDLECFNDPTIAEQIYLSKIPVATGIGHQIDESISDLVADRCFITPTAVAQGITVDRRQVAQKFKLMKMELLQDLVQLLARRSQQLAQYAERFQERIQYHLHLEEMLRKRQKQQILHRMLHQWKQQQVQVHRYHQWFLQKNPLLQIQETQAQYQKMLVKLEQEITLQQQHQKMQLQQREEQLKTYQKVFQLGYIQVSHEDQLIRSAEEWVQLEPTQITLQFPDGEVTLKVAPADLPSMWLRWIKLPRS